jgi:D-alanyl-D-alanine carboxypeptidase
MTALDDLELHAICDKWSRRPLVSSLALRVTTPDRDFIYPKSDDSSHLIASVTKTFFAAIVVMLERDGLIAVDDPAQTYLPAGMMDRLCVVDGVDYSGQVTLADLLSHRSGIPDYYQAKKLDPSRATADVTEEDPGWTPSEALDIARSLPGAFPPHSSKSHYSFTNYQLVGQAIMHVTGLSLGQALKKYITEPLGLANTVLLTHDNLELFHTAQPILFHQHEYRGARRMASLGAEGAIVSTTSDVMTFLTALTSGTLLGAESWKLMQQPLGNPFPRVGYGRGVMTLNLPRVFTRLRRVPALLGHTGATGFFMFHEPHSGVSLVGTANQLGRPLESLRFLGSVASRVIPPRAHRP